MDRKTKGRLAEAKVLAYFIEQGYEVYTPFVDNAKYDLLCNNNGEILRVSVKYTSATHASGSWKVNMAQASRRANNKMSYSYFNPDEFDLIAVYIYPEDRVYVCESHQATKHNLTIKPEAT